MAHSLYLDKIRGPRPMQSNGARAPQCSTRQLSTVFNKPWYGSLTGWECYAPVNCMTHHKTPREWCVICPMCVGFTYTMICPCVSNMHILPTVTVPQIHFVMYHFLIMTNHDCLKHIHVHVHEQ